ncbi:hypothetical protein FE257_003127 [Aspergillus nanangensis]|uniref:Uncharacterized protein n=1 Tax=Aspergillus nanangensis TaxID=2582783 RepID=A0AAD4CBV8_ASPNN|nr:hypothetical protein FE257_003127 [Aspergillus nanangensis]
METYSNLLYTPSPFSPLKQSLTDGQYQETRRRVPQKRSRLHNRAGYTRPTLRHPPSRRSGKDSTCPTTLRNLWRLLRYNHNVPTMYPYYTTVLTADGDTKQIYMCGGNGDRKYDGTCTRHDIEDQSTTTPVDSR